MLRRAKRIKGDLLFQVAEASRLPYASGRFDAVLVYSVFHYFPSYDYAKKALGELLRVCQEDGIVWIGDVPDKAQKEQALSHRARLMRENVPVWPWPDVGPLNQRFYHQAFFIEFCAGAAYRYRIVPQKVKGYIQGQYRFNVAIQKRRR
jgi:ubiquinone/menaquinone biosynthesis C-methylase UbiE